MRTHSIFVLGLAAAGANAASGTGVSTRYWDCCKPSCAWPGKAAVSKPFTACDANDNPISDANTKSGCESGGTAYTCINNSPWALNDRVSYGFAATAISGGSESSWCCACYQLTFTSGKAIGKTMVVQSSNTGGDLGNNHFDILMPGGGLGIFDGCTSQFGGLPGAQYGGISQRSECELMPAALRAGCYWRFDWFMNADNPNHKFTQVKCPAELVARSGCVRNDDSQFPEFVMPTDTTWNPPTPTETAAAYGQCDSLTWDVAKKCPSGYYCSKVTDYYWQCIPGTASTASTSTSAATSTRTTTLQTSTSKTSTSTASTTSSGSGTAALWAQCAGNGFPTLTCVSGSKCVYVNDWYSQCQPS